MSNTDKLEELNKQVSQLVQEEKWDDLISLSTEIISSETDPRIKSSAYGARAFAYYRKDDTDHALEDCNKGLEYTSESAGIYNTRGLVYNRQRKYGKAIEDFLFSGKLKTNLRSELSTIYLATRVDDIFDQNTRPERDEAFGLYMELLLAVHYIQHAQFYRPANVYAEQKTLFFRPEGEVAHYTSLRTLKELVNKSRFRFYNAAYMNDPEEGYKFFEIMKNVGTDVENLFYGKKNRFYPSPAYIGSFIADVGKPKSGEKQKDDLFLWRTYGRHGNQEAAGVLFDF